MLGTFQTLFGLDCSAANLAVLQELPCCLHAGSLLNVLALQWFYCRIGWGGKTWHWCHILCRGSCMFCALFPAIQHQKGITLLLFLLCKEPNGTLIFGTFPLPNYRDIGHFQLSNSHKLPAGLVLWVSGVLPHTLSLLHHYHMFTTHLYLDIDEVILL